MRPDEYLGGPLVVAKPEKSEPITRGDLLYLEPKKSGKDFAQCATCRMFIPGSNPQNQTKHDACIIHGANITTPATASCCFYVPWPAGKPNGEVVGTHARELGTALMGSVSPAESGLVDRPVRCENCRYFDEDESDCELYERLNQLKSPEFPFQLDTKVKPDACCNFNTAGPKVKDEGEGEMQEYLRGRKKR